MSETRALEVWDAGDDPGFIPPRLSKPLVKQLIIRARDLDSRWGPQSSIPVKNRGDRLSRVYWKGRQWAATKYGVECRDGCYAINRSRLWEDDAEHGWIMHMAEKEWVDLEDFAEALRVARIGEMIRTGKRPRVP